MWATPTILSTMLLVTMALPYSLLETSCDKTLSVGDVFVCAVFFLKIYTKRVVNNMLCLFVDFSFLQCLPRGCAILVECPTWSRTSRFALNYLIHNAPLSICNIKYKCTPPHTHTSFCLNGANEISFTIDTHVLNQNLLPLTMSQGCNRW